MKKISECFVFFVFFFENFQFLVVKFSIYLNRRVFVTEWLIFAILAFPRYFHISLLNICFLPIR